VRGACLPPAGAGADPLCQLFQYSHVHAALFCYSFAIDCDFHKQVLDLLAQCSIIMVIGDIITANRT